MSLVCLYLHPQRPPPPRLRASLSSRVAISPSRLLRFESSEALEEQPAVARTQSGIWSVRRASRTRRTRRAPHASARPSTCPSLWRQATLSCFKECHSLVPLIKVLSHLSYIRKPDIYVFKVPRHLKSFVSLHTLACQFICVVSRSSRSSKCRHALSDVARRQSQVVRRERDARRP